MLHAFVQAAFGPWVQQARHVASDLTEDQKMAKTHAED